MSDPVKLKPSFRQLDEPQGSLDWVGMSNLKHRITFRNGASVESATATTKVMIDLNDPRAKGIHMSKLYILLDEQLSHNELNPQFITSLLAMIIESHQELSSRALVEFSFELLLRRPALVSKYSGWNAYPIYIRGTNIDGVTKIDWKFVVSYSSTCPASWTLSRQAIRHEFDEEFRASNTVSATRVRQWMDDGISKIATPHGQRSCAFVTVQQATHSEQFPWVELISQTENALGTPVQTAVLSADEAEFARLNAQNPMFCEDATRKIRASLERDDSIVDYAIRVEHYESLHAHDAVCTVAKGIPDGLKAVP